MNFLDKSKILFFDAVNETYKFLLDKYNQAKQVLTPASPYMQIILVLHNIAQIMYAYLGDILPEFNINKARKVQSIHGLSRLSGHNPTRANCAKGEIKFKIKAEEIQNIPGSYIIIPDRLTVKIKNNNLVYTVLLNKERIVIDSKNLNYFYANIVEGEFDEQTFISNGRLMQSYNVQSRQATFIDDQYVAVYVNGIIYPTYDFFYDIPFDTEGCLVKTGISGGIDIYFGNTNFGKIPPEGAEISVVYLETSGRAGNIYNNFSEVEFEWEEDFEDNLGNEINPNEFFNTSLNSEIAFGSNPENTQFTKLIAPYASRTNVLGNDDNYIYFLRKLNMFSYVDVYTTFDDDFLQDDNIFYLFLIPDVKRKLVENNYFKIPTNNFYLTQNEKNKILDLITSSKRQVPGSDIVFVDPVIKKYILNIALKVYDGYDDQTLRNEILSITSNYFLNVRRRDTIPRSDIVRLIEQIEFVDSVYVEFLSVDNEIAIAKGFYISEEIGADGIQEVRVDLAENENPNLGLDDFGDILIRNGELPIIRGDFTDSNGNYYNEYYTANSLSNINIFIKQVKPKDLFADIVINNLENSN